MMAIGYFTLCFGGQTAQPYAQIDGQRYDVQISNYSDGPSSNADEARTILVDGQALAIRGNDDGSVALVAADGSVARRSEEHTSELQSLMRISYAVFCLKTKKNNTRD